MTKKMIFAMAAFFLTLASCGGNKAAGEAQEKAVDDDAFYATQPVPSGVYGADSYDIQGEGARKGKFDGRVIIALSPENSGMYVYENGNRAKIDYKLVLKAPFEKGDSGLYKAVDVNDLPVTIATDSTVYILSFEKNKRQIKIGFDPKPTSTGTALQMLERISTQIQKNKQ